VFDEVYYHFVLERERAKIVQKDWYLSVRINALGERLSRRWEKRNKLKIAERELPDKGQ